MNINKPIFGFVPAIPFFSFQPFHAMTTLAWNTVFDGSIGFSRYFLDAEGTKWALLAELEEDLVKFDLLRAPAGAPAQLFTLVVDDPIWEAIQEPTYSAAPLVNFIADVLEALKNKKPVFTTTETSKIALQIVFKETHGFRLSASLSFTLREEVSSTVASMLLRQARIHDAAKLVPKPVPIAPVTTADAPTPTPPVPTPSVLEVEETPREKEVVRVMVPVPKVPRGKNPTGIHFGTKALAKKL